MRNAKYCILNKVYEKEEYEKIVSELKKKMTERGEYGEYFPMEISPFKYEESVAEDYFPV
jgi:hypothetical protein